MQNLECPIAGKVLSINIKEGQQVTEDDELFVIEAMKMENPIFGDAGVVKEVCVKIGDRVQEGDILAVIE